MIIKINVFWLSRSVVVEVWLRGTRTNMINEGTETDRKQIVSYTPRQKYSASETQMKFIYDTHPFICLSPLETPLRLP